MKDKIPRNKLLDELLKMKIQIRFCRLFLGKKEIFGDCSLEEGHIIRINLHRHQRFPPARSFIHELLHLKFPDWSEARVLTREKWLWQRMGWRYHYRFYRKMFNAKTIWEDDE